MNLHIICKARSMLSKADFVVSEKLCQSALIFDLENVVLELGFSGSARTALRHSPVTPRFLCMGTAAWPRGSEGAGEGRVSVLCAPSF